MNIRPRTFSSRTCSGLRTICQHTDVRMEDNIDPAVICTRDAMLRHSQEYYAQGSRTSHKQHGTPDSGPGNRVPRLASTVH